MDHPAASNVDPTSNRPPRSRSAAEFERAKRVIPGGSMRQATWFAPHPPYAVRGEGCWVEDLDGRRVLDCANNFFSLVHGHAFPPVVEALRKVVGDGTAFGMPTRHETALAEAIRSRSPRCEQIRFCNSGTEAVMFAVKAARALTGRPAIAKFEGAYHGSYDSLEVSLGSDPSNWNGPHGDPAAVSYDRGTPAGVVADTVVLPYADPERCAAILEREAPRLAAIVLDPLASKIGMVPPPATTIEALRNARLRHGILLICDEVITFRLSYAGAHPLFDLKPDLIALGKIIGGGLPVGAVAGPADNMAIFDHTRGQPPVAFGGTFSANPLTMAAGLAALEAFDLQAVDRLGRIGETLRNRVNAAFAAAGETAQVTGMGSLFRLHLTDAPIRDYRSSYPDAKAKKALAAIHLAMLEAGILLTPNCSGALSTPMTAAEISLIADNLVEATISRRKEE
ncbi:MAG: aspartate aminotransferase family protein [Roseomonas sp.]|nr:aspartate aminotransferase family protein [Roseomonas sp.]